MRYISAHTGDMALHTCAVDCTTDGVSDGLGVIAADELLVAANLSRVLHMNQR